MIKRFNANKARLRRHQRIRNHVKGSQIRPRLNVFRSGQRIYAQIIDDTTGKTLVAGSSLDQSLKGFKLDISLQEKTSNVLHAVADKTTEVLEMAADIAPTRGKGAKTEKAAAQQQKAPAKGQTQKGTPGKGGKPGPTAQVKAILPAA